MTRKARAWTAFAAAASVLTATVATWLAAPWAVDDPLEALARHTPVRTWTDCRGRPVWFERTHDGEWRFPVRLAEIPEEVRAFVLNVEDARFYGHGGVDYLAALRALAQDFGSARVVSGASTIPMQVAGLARPKRPGETFFGKCRRKFLQAAAARKVVRLHAKDEILEAYFNHLPYGGKIVGIRSAAEYYFGLKVSELTVAEASLLVGIPQAPNRFRPDRHPEAARRRQRLVLDAQVRAGRMTAEAADRIFASERLRYRDFGVKTPWEARGNVREWRFVRDLVVGTNETGEIGLTVDRDISSALRRILARRTGDGVRDAAAVVVDVKANEIRGYVGTLDFDSKKGGQVDAARAVRSAGSTLKPFIYLEALAGGVITPGTRLLDAPVRYAGYAPENFDGTFRGEVTAAEALSQSLNTPVVRLLAALGEKRMSEAFARYGLTGSVRTNGLALALGSAGYRLTDLARAYRGLAASAGRGEDRSAVRLAEMLRQRPLPGAAELDVAWKTGTSNNLKDAWCFAYTPDWVVGVWYGNKDGKPSDRLVGVEIAAPAAGEIVSRLYEGRAGDIAWTRVSQAEPEAVSDLLAQRARTMILSPAPQVYRLAPGARNLTLDLRCSEPDVYWYWNGTGLGTVPQHAFPPGRHRLVAVPSDATKREVAVEFVVTDGCQHSRPDLWGCPY